jgi:hypothetical protein
MIGTCLVGLVLPACTGTLRGGDFGPAGAAYARDEPVPLPELSDAPAFRLILAGDGGRPSSEQDPTLALLARWSDEHPERTRVVYLGDNVYPAGLQDGDRARGERILLQQLEAGAARKIFVPGNHDWGYTLFEQLTPGVLANQQAFIEAHADRASFVPRDGCPGPEEIELLAPEEELRGGLYVLALDFHWWLLPEEYRPLCDGIDSTADFIEGLQEAVAEHSDHNLVVVAHHPILSGGPHGGASRGFWMDLGAALARRFYSLQDMLEPGYAEMVDVVSDVLDDHPPVVVAGGHDHSLQVLESGDIARLVIVSGAASRTSGVIPLEGTLFAHAHLGFVVLDFHRLERGDETLVVNVIETGRGADPVFSLAIDLEREEVPAQPLPAPPPGP